MENGEKDEPVPLISETASTSNFKNISIDLFPCAVCIISNDDMFSIIYANTKFYSLFGYTAQEAQTLGFTNLKYIICESDFPDIFQRTKNVPQKSEIKFKSKALHKKGTPIWLYHNCSKISNFMIWVMNDITKEETAKRDFEIIQAEQKIIMQHTGRITAKYDIATKTLIQPQITADMFGLPADCPNAPYSIAQQLLPKEYKNEYIRFFEDMIDGKPYGSTILRMKNITGSYGWYAIKYTLTYHKDGTPFRGIITYEDVTDMQEKELAYKKWKNHFESQRIGSIAYYEYDLTKDIFESIDGELSNELPSYIRKSFSDIALYAADHFILPEDRTKYLDFFSKNKLVAKYFMGQTELQFEHRRLKKDGSYFWALGIIHLVSDPYTNNIKASVLIKNIDTEKESLLKLKLLSSTDPLTGLWNRNMILQEINSLFGHSSNFDTHIFLMIDIDNFKYLNDTMGHQFGDFVLCDIALELKKCVQKDDFCARLGGDEFVLLLKNTPFNANLSNRLQKICSSLSKTYENGLSTTVSIGIALYPRDGTNFNKLYQKADSALYQAKRNGRNQFVFYE